MEEEIADEIWEYEQENQDVLRERFEDYLVDECGYAPYVAEESDDGRWEFVKNEYYLIH